MINLLQAVHITVIRLINYFALGGQTMKAEGKVRMSMHTLEVC